MPRTLSPLVLYACLAAALLAFVFQAAPAPAAAPPPPDATQPAASREAALVEQAVRAAISDQAELTPLFIEYETLLSTPDFSAGADWAVVMLTPLIPGSEQVVNVEPGLAISRLEAGAWRTYLPGDAGWADAVRSAPQDLFSPTARQFWLDQEAAAAAEAQAAGPFGGYLLPWAAGETMVLTQSVHHDKYDSSLKAHYAFDFAKPGYPSGMYNVHAAKSGRVKRFIDTWPNGHYNSQNPNEANYLVIEDTSTSPATYQLYLHLAQGSIPAEIKQVGAPVQQGQLLGLADDTGLSTGNHLHFHVHLNSNSYWDRAVDITFEDVDINGGRPRIAEDQAYCLDNQTYNDVCGETRSRYVSANTVANADKTAPTAGLLAPQPGLINTNPTLHIEAWAQDPYSGLAGAQVRAYYAGGWRDVGEPSPVSPFTLEWDVCAADLPVGPLSLAVEAWDAAGNTTSGLPGLVHLVNNYACPPQPPACTPAANQVALFSQPDWQGACAAFAAGDFNSAALGDLGPGRAQSIQVGANVQATLYQSASFTQHGETFFAADFNLADNWVGAQTIQSLKVRARTSLPGSPSLVWPGSSGAAGGEPGVDQFPAGASLAFAWENTLGGAEFLVTLEQDGVARSSGWLSTPYWNAAGSLPPGEYRWQAAARNPAGQSAPSPWRYFTVLPDEGTPASPAAFPFEDAFEIQPAAWQSDAPWQWGDALNHTEEGASAWSVAAGEEGSLPAGQPFSANLTSPPIPVPTGQAAFLRFWYWAGGSGDAGRQTSQRWVQVAAEGENFTNLLQLDDDDAQAWLPSPAVDLSGYAGRTIRLRFHFTDPDGAPAAPAWAIDDVSLSGQPLANCTAGISGGADPLTAPAAYGERLEATLCPGAARHFYTFSGQAGDQVGVRVDAAGPVQVTLLAEDGRSILAEGAALLPDGAPPAFLAYTLRRSASYIIKVKAADYPGAAPLPYALSLDSDPQPPGAEFLTPTPSQVNAPTANVLELAVQDLDAGVSHVSFYYHSPDWVSGAWELVDVDITAQDGWRINADLPAAAHAAGGFAWSALVYDLAGNVSAAAVWDQQPPPRLFLPVARRSGG